MEELTKIVEMVGTLGEQGQAAFVWWLVYRIVESLLVGVVILGVVFMLLGTLKWIFKQATCPLCRAHFPRDYESRLVRNLKEHLQDNPECKKAKRIIKERG